MTCGVEVLIWTTPAVSSGASLKDLASPAAFQPASTLVSVACGGGLAAFLTEERRLYLVDLGEPHAPQCGSPRIVEALRDSSTTAVSCGSSHVVAVTAAGSACALLGGRQEAEAGLPRGEALATSGKLARLELPLGLRAACAACGDSHVLLATDTGALFAFGDGRHGQLGLGHMSEVSTPLCVQALAHLHITDIAAGCAHSCAATTLGNLFTWGDNRHGQLGDGSLAPKATPLLVALESVQQVSASAATAALCTNGALYSWGFRGFCTPRLAFDQRVRRVALSHDVLCVVSDAGELFLQDVGAASGDSVLAHRDVAAIAAASGHVVALAGLAAVARKPPPEVLGPGSGITTTSTMPEGSASPRLRCEATELAATNQRLAMVLDEVRAEHFLESAHLRSLAETADARSIRASSTLARERNEASRLSNAAYALEMQDELASLRADLTRKLHEHDRELSNGGAGGSGGSLAAGMPTADGQEEAGGGGTGDGDAARDLRAKHAQLSREHGQLLAEREDLQSEILRLRGELSESGRRLRRIEDGCIRTRAVAERQRAQVGVMKRRVQELEEELLASEAQQLAPFPGAPFSAAAPETEAQVEAEHRGLAAQRQGLARENAELLEEQAMLGARLQELQNLAAAESVEQQELLAELQRFSQEHTAQEQQLAQQQMVAAKLQGEISGLRSECAFAAKQARDLERISAEARRSARAAAGEALRQRHALMAEAATDLRRRLAAATVSEAELGEELRLRAAAFAEEAAPLYAEAQRLQAAISECRRRAPRQGHQQQYQQAPRRECLQPPGREGPQPSLLPAAPAPPLGGPLGGGSPYAGGGSFGLAHPAQEGMPFAMATPQVPLVPAVAPRPGLWPGAEAQDPASPRGMMMQPR